MPAPDAQHILAARARLAKGDPALAVADAAAPPFIWRQRPGGLPGLVRMIVEQQVSTASAAAIWARIEAGLGQISSHTLLAADEAALRGLGLSGQKARYVRAIAEAEASGAIDPATLAGLGPEEAIARLTAVKGVGRWTAEIYLLFCEGRPDAFPAGDLALQEGLRLAEGAAARLPEKALYARAEAWRPDRGVAAHLLWAYYSHVRRGGATPAARENA